MINCRVWIYRFESWKINRKIYNVHVYIYMIYIHIYIYIHIFIYIHICHMSYTYVSTCIMNIYIIFNCAILLTFKYKLLMQTIKVFKCSSGLQWRSNEHSHNQVTKIIVFLKIYRSFRFFYQVCGSAAPIVFWSWSYLRRY